MGTEGIEVARWVNHGEIGKGVRSQEDILAECEALMEGANAMGIIGGGAMFEATNGKHYSVTLEAVISEASEEEVRDSLFDDESAWQDDGGESHEQL